MEVPAAALLDIDPSDAARHLATLSAADLADTIVELVQAAHAGAGRYRQLSALMSAHITRRIREGRGDVPTARANTALALRCGRAENYEHLGDPFDPGEHLAEMRQAFAALGCDLVGAIADHEINRGPLRVANAADTCRELLRLSVRVADLGDPARQVAAGLLADGPALRSDRVLDAAQQVVATTAADADGAAGGVSCTGATPGQVSGERRRP